MLPTGPFPCAASWTVPGRSEMIETSCVRNGMMNSARIPRVTARVVNTTIAVANVRRPPTRLWTRRTRGARTIAKKPATQTHVMIRAAAISSISSAMVTTTTPTVPMIVRHGTSDQVRAALFSGSGSYRPGMIRRSESVLDTALCTLPTTHPSGGSNVDLWRAVRCRSARTFERQSPREQPLQATTRRNQTSEEVKSMAFLLWILAVILVIAGIVAIVRREYIWGIVLVIVGLLVGPGGVSIFT